MLAFDIIALIVGREEVVYVTHIRNPGHFVVQRASENDRLRIQAKQINRHCNNPENLAPDAVETGKDSSSHFPYKKSKLCIYGLDILVDTVNFIPVIFMYLELTYNTISFHLFLPSMTVQCRIVA